MPSTTDSSFQLSDQHVVDPGRATLLAVLDWLVRPPFSAWLYCPSLFLVTTSVDLSTMRAPLFLK